MRIGSRFVSPGNEFVKRGKRLVEPGIRLVIPGMRLVDPGIALVKPGARLVDPGSAFVNPGARLVEPGTALVNPGRLLVATICTGVSAAFVTVTAASAQRARVFLMIEPYTASTIPPEYFRPVFPPAGVASSTD